MPLRSFLYVSGLGTITLYRRIGLPHYSPYLFSPGHFNRRVYSNYLGGRGIYITRFAFVEPNDLLIKSHNPLLFVIPLDLTT
jgi:hypothetical protein